MNDLSADLSPQPLASAATPSMTGSAWAVYDGGDKLGSITIELRSVNGRGLTLKMRLAPELGGCERRIEDLVRARISRGTLFLTIAIASPDPVEGAIDGARFAAAAAQLGRLAADAGLSPPTVRDVLTIPGVVRGNVAGRDPREGPADDLPAEVASALLAALDQLTASRETEGRVLAVELGQQLEALEGGLQVIVRRAPELVDRHRERLLTRVREFLDGHGVGLEPAEVVQQVALFADKVDVNEEITRLRAHLAKARAMLTAGGVIGRNLEFLTQEMLREVNTIGSKSPDVEISHEVVAMKSTIDRLKEQVANLE